jgi:endoglucanase
VLQRLNNRSLTEPVPSIPEGFEMTVWLVFGQTLNMRVATWTPKPLRPSDDPRPRHLYPPTTAATLNMAAVAAQAARIWAPIDRRFAKRCLAAAVTAYKAAKAHPDLPANPSFDGGGPYADNTVTDEFYWAACELFVTTADMHSWKEIRQSPRYLTVNRDQIAQSGYVWGSNSAIMNNMIILGKAHDFTHQVKYAAAVNQGMDYLLGRNPNDKSYTSGYGARPLEHPTHLFWARQLSPDYPPPAPGAVAGGPNPNLEDPAIGAACPYGCSSPQTAYVDDIESYSTNEVAINWNAPLAWVVAFIDEHRRLVAGSSTVLGE